MKNEDDYERNGSSPNVGEKNESGSGLWTWQPGLIIFGMDPKFGTMTEVEMSTNNSHLTAITRKKLSLPIRERLLEELSNPCMRRLDYGCGKGFDANALGMFKYDPYYAPDEPQGTFDYIYCGYVLNVLNPRQGQAVIDHIQSLLNRGGRAFIVVRRDLKKEGITKANTYQRTVKLEGAWPSVDTKKYALYEITKTMDVKVK